MRISRHQMFMEMAHVVAKRSVCMRLNVGAIIVLRNNVIAIGYNGPAAGMTHCDQIGCEVGEKGGCSRSIHAEKNALSRIDSLELENNDLILYVTHSPCLPCAEAITQTGIKEIYFRTPYRNLYPIQHLASKQIRIFQCAPNGYITSAIQ